MKVNAFVIHLRRAEQRRPQVDRIIEACPVNTTILDAVDGRAMSAEERTQVYTTNKLFEPRYPFEIGPGEIGCFLSHRRAWQAIIDGDLDAGLIIEDDVEIDQIVFGDAFELATAHMDELGYIQFQVRDVSGPSKTIARQNGAEIFRPKIVPLRTSSQLVSKREAEALLAKTETFDRPVDGVLQLVWETGVPIYCARPSGVTDRTVQTGGSTISGRSSGDLLAKLRKQVLRWQYRRNVASLSHKEMAAKTGPDALDRAT